MTDMIARAVGVFMSGIVADEALTERHNFG
jgi:hypothetical protein